jgi:DNA-binding CsgD family transcriptional regulator
MPHTMGGSVGESGVSRLRRYEGAWLDLAADLLAAPAEGWPAQTVTRLLVETFDAPGGSFYQPHADGSIGQAQWPASLFARHWDEIRRWSEHEAPREHPLLRYYLATGDQRPTQVLDVPERFADRRVHGRWQEWSRSFHDADVSSQLALPVGPGPAPCTSFIVGRADRFTPQEMLFAVRVHRLLAGIDRHVTLHDRWARRTGSAGASAAEAAGLTPRELTVLELLATGCTARAIGRRLAVAERTVQKHLQRIYAKLGVTDRLAAVLRAEHLHLLPPRT